MKPQLKILVEDQLLQPFEQHFVRREAQRSDKKRWFVKGDVEAFARGHEYYPLHIEGEHLVIREWAPNATAIFLLGDFNQWQKLDEYKFTFLADGIWELKIPQDNVQHLDYYKLLVCWDDQQAERIPSHARYVVQDEDTHLFCARFWNPSKQFVAQHTLGKIDRPLLIYEAHIGMATEELRVGTYKEFQDKVLPHVKELGYNAIQLMAIQEHPYYGSFGYQVSNFFAPSSRFGTPDELKELIDEAHHLGIAVIMDIVHSHAVDNVGEGLNLFDGSEDQYFYPGDKGNHPAWGTKCFNYQKKEVVQFLLSNCHYWITEFHFDGLRFDGVTSMLYHDHGLGSSFTSYEDYFSLNVHEAALDYLYFANVLLEQLGVKYRIAEDMSGMPGLAFPIDQGGIGFTHRLAMGIPDFWIKLIKELPDEQWNMDSIWYELMNVRWNEGAISYCESHDQALVGDKTLIFRLADKDMYDHFSCHLKNTVVDRAIALHKLIRALTIITAKDGYLTFMGNEFGHPEWIDFPREGNNWSYQYCRRQWSLVENKDLCYFGLQLFEQDFLKLLAKYEVFTQTFAVKEFSHNTDKILVIERQGLIFCFNFHSQQSYQNYTLPIGSRMLKEIFNSDLNSYNGFARLKNETEHWPDENGQVRLYLPNRTLIVLLRC